MAFKDAGRQRGLYRAAVVRSERISPHLVRVTVGGDDLKRLPRRGYDHWFRLFLPREPGPADFSSLPEQFGMAGYAKFKASGAAKRFAVRNYTVRRHRPEQGEVDIDFVAHGDRGVAGPWAQRAQPGDQLALIDQGCGFAERPGTGHYVLAGDESALAAILGILRDLPRQAQGVAWIEIPDQADAQPSEEPAGVTVRWLPRGAAGGTPGAAALAALRAYTPPDPAAVTAYIAGEQTLAAQGRRHLVAAGVPKQRIEFTGYWRAGATHS
ncbi:MAG: siderophore-interacting protein [Propionibacteriaceae bacterium]|jgi:NADPH-dependent ferric siderophore reductase|nr:siderophore-interacting protein [Propionibacteriaceae bacterium]